jgi:iron complex outermembrane receptor protein
MMKYVALHNDRVVTGTDRASIKFSLFVGVSLIALAAPSPTLAEDLQARLSNLETVAQRHIEFLPLQVAQVHISEPQSFSISAGDLQAALLAFSQQVDLQLLYPADLTTDHTTQGIQGSFTPQQALTRLLDGTDLIYEIIGGDTIRIEKIADGSGAMVLSPITVEGLAGPSRQSEIGNMSPEYPGGQVARGGKLGMLGNSDFMDTPFNQTNFTAELMKNQQAKVIGDVLESDPSVYITYPESSGVGNYSIRGFTLAGSRDFSQDGLYGLFHGANVGTEQFERVEVLKGPSAMVNGISPFGSVGGTVNLMPKRAKDETLIEFTPQYSSDKQIGGHVDIGYRFGEDKKFGARFNGVYRDGDTAIDRQSQEQQMASLGLDYLGDDLRLTGDFAYSELNLDVPRRPISGVAAGVPIPEAPDSRSNWKQPWTFGAQKTWNGAMRGEYDLADNWTLHVSGGHSIYHNSQDVYDATIQDTSGTLGGRNATSLNLAYTTSTIEGGLNGHVKTGPVDHKLALSGTRLWFEQRINFSTVAVPTSNLYNPVFFSRPNFASIKGPSDAPKTGEKDNQGFALADTLSVLDERVQLTMGGRWQRVTTTNYNATTGVITSEYDKDAITPAIGLVVKPRQDVSLYANYIEGLQEGSTAPTSAANAGEVFAPTVTEQYEAGIKLDTGQLGLTLSAFQVSQASSFTDPSTNVFSVNGEERHRGIELNAFGELTEDVRVLGGVTYMDAELAKTQGGKNQGNHPQGVPEFRANLRGEWDMPFLHGLTVSGTATYASSTFIDQANLQKNDAWIRFDAGLRYSIEREDAEPIVVRADIRNLADANYWLVQGSFLGLSDPRTFVLSTTFSF